MQTRARVVGAALIALLCTAAQAEPQKWAVLIGVNDYVHLGKLEFCGKDVEALRGALHGGGIPADHTFAISDGAAGSGGGPTKKGIETGLRMALQLVKRGDLLVVAFSGHGVRIDEVDYLCPVGARLDDPKGTMVALDWVYEQMKQCRASQKLLLVDACRDVRNVAGAGKGAKAVHDLVKSLALTEPPEGICRLSSCMPGEKSYEDPNFGRGVFMHFLIEGLAGEADRRGQGNDDGIVNVLELFNYAADRTGKFVARHRNARQRPVLKGTVPAGFNLAEVRRGPPAPVTNSLGMKLVRIPAGEFVMGSSDSPEVLAEAFAGYGKIETERFENEYPPHRVRITKPFYLGAQEVTVGQFRQFVEATGYKSEPEKDGLGGWGWNESAGKFEGPDAKYSWRNTGSPQGENYPVVNVTWNDAKAFCRWLGKKEGKTYRLPAEAEWEYTCRAGTTTRYAHGDDPEGLARVGNVADSAAKARFPAWPAIDGKDGHVFRAPVGRFRANAMELHDMHGNVSEWCEDWYDADYYGQSSVEDPKGPASGAFRSLRGGSWVSPPHGARSAARYGNSPDYRYDGIGFRVVCEG